MRTKMFTLCLVAVFWVPACTQASEQVFSQAVDGQSTYGPSELWIPSGINSEVADDFDVIGNIDRVYASGFIWGTVDFLGAYVRFYEYRADGTPGALQREYFVTTGFDQGAIDATLSPPFPATGKHFISVQPVINYWYWWSSHSGAPRGQAFYFRDLASGQTVWQHGDNLNFNVNADVAFQLFGTVTGPGHIDSLSANTLDRSGYLEILGTNLGGSGQVLINGIPALIADWASNRIVAYVPEAAHLTTVPVQVVNASGTSSNSVNLIVTARQPDGRVNWRFRMNGPYAEVRPVIASDGTVYAIDAFFHLYAIAPDGGLKWLVRGAGNKGVAVGADGVIYVASEDAITAFNPDGTTKWTFVQDPRAFICLGVSVGPDGNIYSVGTQGMGVFSLTPEGTLRWTNFEVYSRPIIDYGEIVFGPNGSNQQLYFAANNHLRALRLDGTPVFTLAGAFGQPAVAPDGSIHGALAAYSPNGNLQWLFSDQYPYNTFTPPDVGSDGVHYFVQNLSQLFALNSDGSQRWHVSLPDYLAGPIVDPLNTQLVMGSADTLDHAGFIVSKSSVDGHELWRVTLPIEDPTVFNPALGIFGFNQFVDTRARFTADSQTAYLVTATATGDNDTSKSFVYSVNAGAGNTPVSLSMLTVNPGSVMAGGTSTGTVTLTSAATSNTVVNLSSNNAAAIVPSTVTVQTGQTQATFSITTASVTADTSVTISATLGGSTKTAGLTVMPAPTAKSVTLSPTSLAGGLSSTGTVTISAAAPAEGSVVTLSSNRAEATVPASVTVPSGLTTATFKVTTTPVASQVIATISATLGVTKTKSLTIKPPALSKVSFSPTSVWGGFPATGTVTLTGVAAVDTVVTLSSNAAEATVPASVTVLAGHSTATFTANTVVVYANAIATVTGTFNGVSKSANLTVKSNLVYSVSLTPTMVTGGSSSAGKVTLSSAAGPGGVIVTLSSDRPNATVPASVTVLAGQKTANFTVNTTPVGAQVLATISGSVGASTRSKILTINP